MVHNFSFSFRTIVGFYLRYLSRPLGLTSGRKYLEECESIRGWAVLLVVLYHWIYFIVPMGPVNTNPLMAFVYAGGTGVNLFYVLSAFLLSMSWFRGNGLSISKFYSNRLLRIMPMYLTVILIAAVYTGNYWEALKSALFLDLHIFTMSPFGGVWLTLAVEMQFYLILPLLMTSARNDHWRFLGIFLLLAMTIISLIYYFVPRGAFSLSLGPFGIANIFSRWPAFLVGIICAYLFVRTDLLLIKQRLHHGWMGKGGSEFFLFVAIAIMGCYFKILVAEGLLSAHAKWPFGLIIESAFWGLILLAIICLPRRRTTGLLINPFMNLLGILSYSIYLIHLPMLKLTMDYINKTHTEWLTSPSWELILASLALLALILGVATLTYIYVELPFIQKKIKK